MQTEKLITKYLTLFGILLLFSFLFFGLIEFLSAFLGSVVFYLLFRKFMAYLVFKKGWNKALAAVLIITITFLIVVLPIGVVSLMVTTKILEIANDPELIKEYMQLIEDKLKLLPGDYTMEDISTQISSFMSNHIGDVLNSTASILSSVLMMYFFLYFLLVNVRKLERGLTFYLPFEDEKLQLFGDELVDQTIGNAIGVPLVAAVQGLSAWLAYWIAGVPDAGLYALLTGVSSIIPLVGTAIIWVPISVLLLASNMIWQGIFVGLFCMIIMTNLDNVVRMVVFKKIGDVHPVITVLGVLFGLSFFGLPGLVFGPLLISYLLILLRIYHTEYNVKKSHLKEYDDDGNVKMNQNQMMSMINKYLFPTEKMRQDEMKKSVAGSFVANPDNGNIINEENKINPTELKPEDD